MASTLRHKAATQVATALVQIAAVPIPSGVDIIVASFAVENVANLNAFQVRGKLLDQSITLAAVAADFTGPKAPVLAASGDLTALAANSVGWLMLAVKGLAEVQFWASCVSAGPTQITTEIRGG